MNDSVFMSNEELKTIRDCVANELRNNACLYGNEGLYHLACILYKLEQMINDEEDYV